MVDLEALVDGELLVQYERRYGSLRAVTRFAEDLRERAVRFGQPTEAVPSNAVRVWVEAGHDARMGWERQGCRGDAAFEQRTLAGQAVEMGRDGGGLSVAFEIVGAGGVEGDQEYVEIGGDAWPAGHEPPDAPHPDD